MNVVVKAQYDCLLYLKKPDKKKNPQIYIPGAEKLELVGTSFSLYPIKQKFFTRLANFFRLEIPYLIANEKCQRAGVMTKTFNLRYQVAKLFTDRLGAHTLERRCKLIL